MNGHFNMRQKFGIYIVNGYRDCSYRIFEAVPWRPPPCWISPEVVTHVYTVSYLAALCVDTIPACDERIDRQTDRPTDSGPLDILC